MMLFCVRLFSIKRRYVPHKERKNRSFKGNVSGPYYFSNTSSFHAAWRVKFTPTGQHRFQDGIRKFIQGLQQPLCDLGKKNVIKMRRFYRQSCGGGFYAAYCFRCCLFCSGELNEFVTRELSEDG